MKFSEQLIERLQKIRATYPVLDFADKNTLLRNMVFTYHVMRATTNLLRNAIVKAEGEYLEYLKVHLEEELEHEAWMARDLATAGIDVKKSIVPRKAVEMAGSQYYLINHVAPEAMLGYMAVLECFPQPLELISAMEAAHGTELIRTLRYHAHNDIDHGQDVLALIDKVDEQWKPLVLQNAINTAVYFGQACLEIQGGD